MKTGKILTLALVFFVTGLSAQSVSSILKKFKKQSDAYAKVIKQRKDSTKVKVAVYPPAISGHRMRPMWSPFRTFVITPMTSYNVRIVPRSSRVAYYRPTYY